MSLNIAIGCVYCVGGASENLSERRRDHHAGFAQVGTVDTYSNTLTLTLHHLLFAYTVTYTIISVLLQLRQEA